MVTIPGCGHSGAMAADKSRSVTKLRSKTGLTEYGGILVDRGLGGNPPMLAIDGLRTENEASEQKGFGNLVKGVFGMFRNPTAHASRLYWQMTKEEAEGAFSLISLLHRRLDAASMPPRPGTSGASP